VIAGPASEAVTAPAGSGSTACASMTGVPPCRASDSADTKCGAI
jgi:hypothetical protein